MIDYANGNLKKIDPKILIGKTITDVDNSAVNVLSLEFSDGSSVAIDTNLDGTGICRIEVSEE